MKFKRDELTKLCQRATPEQWTKFTTASPVIKILRDKEPNYLYTDNYFEEKRYPGVRMFFMHQESNRVNKPSQINFYSCVQFMTPGTVNFYQMISLELK